MSSPRPQSSDEQPRFAYPYAHSVPAHLRNPSPQQQAYNQQAEAASSRRKKRDEDSPSIAEDVNEVVQMIMPVALTFVMGFGIGAGGVLIGSAMSKVPMSRALKVASKGGLTFGTIFAAGSIFRGGH